MKSKRRHELQTNELADWLGRQAKQVGPYTKYIVGGVLAAVGLWIIVTIIVGRGQAQKEGEMAALFEAFDAKPLNRIKELERVATENPDSVAGDWARLVEADLKLIDGAQQLFSANKSLARDKISGVVKVYESLEQKAAAEFIRVRAAYQLALAYESLSRVDDAIKQLEKVVETWPESYEAELAEGRLAKLRGGIAERVYGAFDSFVYKPPETSGQQTPPGGVDLPPDIGSELHSDLPEDSDLRLPAPLPPPGEDELKTGGAEGEEKPSGDAEIPADGDEPGDQ